MESDPAGDRPDHDVLGVLQIGGFRRLWLALGLSSFGDWLGLLATAAMAGTVVTGSYTAQNFAIAGVFLVRLLPAVLLGPLAGAVADRFDRRATLVLGDVLRFVLLASIPVVGTLGWLYAATVLVEVVALFWGPAKDASVPNLVPRHRLEAANQVSLVATYGTAPLAALVYAGLALLARSVNAFLPGDALDPVALALYLDALTFLVSALTIWRLELPPGPVRVPGGRAGVLGAVVEGWRFVGRTPLVRGLVTGMLGAFAAAGFVVGLAQTFVTDLGAGQAGFAVLFGAVFVGLAGGMWAGPRLLRGLSRRRLFGLSLVVSGAFLVALAPVPDVGAAALLVVVVGAGGGVAWVTGYTLLGLEVDDEVRGRTFAFLASASRVVLVLVLALGPALAGLLGTHVLRVAPETTWTVHGAAWVLLLAGVLAVVMGLVALHQMDDRPGVPLLADLRRSLSPPRMALPGAGHGLPGVLLVLEGGDGCGKSTQAGLLGRWLEAEGHEVVLTREPGATPLGARLRQLLLDPAVDVGARAEALLFAADRADHVATVLRPALERGAVVVCDRYVDSSVAYQGAGRDLSGEEVARLSQWATGGLQPDLTVLLDLPPEIQRVRRAADAARSGEDRIEAAGDGFHARVRAAFRERAALAPHRYLVLDASEAREELQRRIRERVREVVPLSRRRVEELRLRLVEEERVRRRRAEAEIRAEEDARRSFARAGVLAADTPTVPHAPVAPAVPPGPGPDVPAADPPAAPDPGARSAPVSSPAGRDPAPTRPIGPPGDADEWSVELLGPQPGRDERPQ